MCPAPSCRPACRAPPGRGAGRSAPTAACQPLTCADATQETRSGGRQLPVLGLGEVLMGGAVPVVWQRHALAGRALARRRAALGRLSADGRVRRDRVLGEVAGDDAVDVTLIAHREITADVAVQRARGVGEVVAVGRHALNDGLARAQHMLVVEARAGAVLGREDVRRELSVYGPAELVHGGPSLSWSIS